MKQNYVLSAKLMCYLLLFLGCIAQGVAQEISFGSSGLLGETINNPTSLDFGPDGKLYVSQQDGTIWRFTIERDNAAPGEGQYSAINTETINHVKLNTPNHTDDGLATTIQIRQITGILATGTAENPILYVTSSDNLIGGGGSGNDKNLDTNSGVLSKLTYNDGSWDKVDLIRGLPRCEENHSINGLDIFEKNGDTYMLVQQGGHANKGAPSNNFVGTPEYLLSGSILIVNLTQLENMPIYTDPRSNTEFVYDLPTLNDPNREDITNTHPSFPYALDHPLYNTTIDLGDPFGGDDGLNQAFAEPNGPVQVFSPGYRNAYDIVITENGNVYTFDNGPNTGWGGLPLIYDKEDNLKGDESSTTYNPEDGDYVKNEMNEVGSTGHGDTLHYVGTIEDPNGTYYGGHPNPIAAFPSRADLITYKNIDGSWQETARYELENTLEGVSGYFNTSFSIDNFPDDTRLGKYLADSLDSDEINILDIINSSTNGMCEYTASNFEGALKGSLLAASFNGAITRYKMNASGDNYTEKETLFSGFGATPLDVIALPDSHPYAGTVWAATYGADNITIFEPSDVTCLSEDDIDFDPSADYDNDGYSNQDEIDNNTNFCSGGSTPKDNDADFISDLNDTDDDNDGITDVNDAFAIDPENGLSTQLPILYSFFNNDPGTGFFGLGFTGLMLDPTGNTDYLTQFDEENLSFGGAAGKASIDLVTSGEAYRSYNNQDNAFQFGVNVDTNSNPFTIQTRLESPFFGINGVGTTPVNYQSAGMFIGNGDQDNYLKFVLQNGTYSSDTTYGVQVLLENNGSITSTQKYNIENIISGNAIDFYVSVNPALNQAQPYLSINGGASITTIGDPIILPSNFLDATDSQGMAVGILSTSIGSTAVPYSAIWDYFTITEDQSGVVSATPEMLDFGSLTQNSDALQINIGLLNQSGPDQGAVTISGINITGEDADMFSSAAAQTFLIGPGNQYTVPVAVLPNGSPGIKNALLEVSHSGIDSPLIIPLIAEIKPNFSPYIRINAGGPEVEASDAGPNWIANSLEDDVITETYSVNTGNIASFNLTYDNKHNSIPSYIDENTFNELYANERWDPEAAPEMEFTIPVTNGNYIINLFLGNGFSGTNSVGSRIYDIFIEDNLVQNDLDLISTFGNKSGGILSFPANIIDSVINISFGHETENPLINAIEILKEDILFEELNIESIETQNHNVNDIIDFAVVVSGGNPNLNYNYSIEGQPDGIDIEPTNGHVFGSIDASALDGGIAHNGVHTTVITVNQEGIESATVEFTWSIYPAPIEWIDKDESEDYVARHECSFVQAGDKFIMFGGRESADELDVYDYTTNSWSKGGVAPMEFNHFQATTYKGLIWVIGAFQTNDYPNEIPVDYIYMYNPITEQWIQGPEIPENRRRGGAGLVVHDDKFYIIGGNTDGHNGGYVSWLDEYDPSTGTWTELNDAPHARDHFHASNINGKLYAIGGRLSGGDQGVFAPLIPEIDVYDFESEIWITLEENLNLPTPRAAPAIAILENEIFVMGGEGTEAGPAYDIVEAFDVTTNTWSTKNSMHYARHGTQAIASGNGIYIAGGSPNRGGGNQKNMEVYNEDNPSGEVIIDSELTTETNVLEFTYERYSNPVELSIPLITSAGTTGTFIKSITLNGEGFVMTESYNNTLISADSQLNIDVLLSETKLSTYNGTILITYDNGLEIIISLTGTVINDDDVVTNLALNKTVSALTEQSTNPATNIVDGNPDSRWSAQNFPQSLVVDLGALSTITSTEVICYNDRAYQYIIETATSPNGIYSLLVDRTDNTTPGTNASPIMDSFTETIAQYVKITVLGAAVYNRNWVSIEELRIFGYETPTYNVTAQMQTVLLFPNPATTSITIHSNTLLTSISILNLTGNQIAEYSITESYLGSNRYFLNVEYLDAGIYFVNTKNVDGEVTNSQLVITD